MRRPGADSLCALKFLSTFYHYGRICQPPRPAFSSGRAHFHQTGRTPSLFDLRDRRMPIGRASLQTNKNRGFRHAHAFLFRLFLFFLTGDCKARLFFPVSGAKAFPGKKFPIRLDNSAHHAKLAMDTERIPAKTASDVRCGRRRSLPQRACNLPHRTAPQHTAARRNTPQHAARYRSAPQDT